MVAKLEQAGNLLYLMLQDFLDEVSLLLKEVYNAAQETLLLGYRCCKDM